MGQIDEPYFNKLIAFIQHWQSDDYTESVIDMFDNKNISITGRITTNKEKFILHLKHYIDQERERPTLGPVSNPALTISNDYNSFRIKISSHQKREWVCPFIIHNPHPTHIVKIEEFKFIAEENGKGKRITKRRVEFDPGEGIVFN